MVGPVAVFMRVHDAIRRQFFWRVGMVARDMVRMIMAAPGIAGIVVGYEQALSVMPAVAEDVVVLLTFGCALVITQAVPLKVGMLLDAFSCQRGGYDTIASSLEEEAEVNVHQAIETELLVNPANFAQQFAAEGHQVAFNSINIWTGILLELA